MDDTISRQALLDKLQKNLHEYVSVGIPRSAYPVMKMFVRTIKSLPSAQPERKKGEWEEIEVIPEAYDIAGVKTWASKMRCNQCGFTTFAIEGGFAQYYFCPNCGSYNGGKQE